MVNPFSAFKIWLKNRSFWESICSHCGRCCFEREMDEDGHISVNYALPCEFFDKDTHLCIVYSDRFNVCDRCCKMTGFQAAYGRFVPDECAYARLFRNTDCHTQA